MYEKNCFYCKYDFNKCLKLENLIRHTIAAIFDGTKIFVVVMNITISTRPFSSTYKVALSRSPVYVCFRDLMFLLVLDVPRGDLDSEELLVFSRIFILYICK